MNHQIRMRQKIQGKIARASQKPAHALLHELVLGEGFHGNIEEKQLVQHHCQKENQHFSYAATVATFKNIEFVTIVYFQVNKPCLT